MSRERYQREHDWIIDNNKRKTKESLIVYDEEYNTLDDLCELLNSQDQNIADLEAKLEQSQKERELDNAFWKQECDSLQKALSEKEKEIVKEKTQDKISFAVEQLEKVYEYTADVWWVDGVSEAVCNFINQQIKELKEKTNVKD